MTVTQLAGNTSYMGIKFSDAISGGNPDGNVISLVCPKWKMPTDFLQKISDIAGGTSYSSKDGKYSKKVTLPECYIYAEQQANNTAEFNTIIQQIHKWNDLGDSYIYFWIYNFVDSDYVQIGYLNGTAYDYLKCHITNFTPEGEDGNVYKITNLTIRKVDY